MFPRSLLVGAILAATVPGSAGAAPPPGGSDMAPTPSAVDYSTVDSHQQQQQSVQFFNTNASGGGATFVSGVYVTGADPSSFYVDNRYDFCSSNTIGAGSSCHVTVVFNPQGSITQKSAFLHMNDSTGSVDVPLTGRGVSGTLSANPAALDLGPAVVNGQNAQAQVTLTAGDTSTTDTQGNPIVVSAGVRVGGNLMITGPDASSFSVAFGSCQNANLGPGNTCSEQMNFVPSSPGQKNATLVVSSDSNGGTLTIPLTGDGLQGPNISLSPSGTDFGNIAVGSSTTQTFTLTDTGDAPLGIQEALVVGGAPRVFPIVSDSCTGHAVNPGASCSLTIGFSPTAAGEKDASLFFITNQPSPVTTYGLTGTGVTSPTSTPSGPGAGPAAMGLNGVSVTGSPVAGETLTCAAVGAGGASYQWLRRGSVIPGAVHPLLVLSDVDVGATLSCRVQGAGGGPARTSKATLPVAPMDLSRLPGSLVRTSVCRLVQAPNSIRVAGRTVTVIDDRASGPAPPLRLQASAPMRVAIDNAALAGGRTVSLGPARLAFFRDGIHKLEVRIAAHTTEVPVALGPCRLVVRIRRPASRRFSIRVSARVGLRSLALKLTPGLRLSRTTPSQIEVQAAGRPRQSFEVSGARTTFNGITVAVTGHRIVLTGLPPQTGGVSFTLHSATAPPDQAVSATASLRATTGNARASAAT